MRFFFFRLGKVFDFRFCFYHLMIEADMYSYWVFFFLQILCYKFFLDFSSEFVWHKNFESVLDIA